MKKLLASLIICAGVLVAYAETSIQCIVELPGQTKQQIYDKSMYWITTIFVSGKGMVSEKNQSTGRIIGKGKILLGSIGLGTAYVYENITIDCINGKARITIVPVGCAQTWAHGDTDGPCNFLTIGAQTRNLDKTTQKLVDNYSEHMKSGGSAPWDGN